ncbi:Prevent host death protein, Phd antitoxin [hydrothermal vent metagenome]|uniref:Prevent host death protein, Phd antitoxin n=1 Tax=hydrothermal vent metagenome TaxID=652676 RepID=A0A3B0UL87_9ZZZZ
MATKFSEDIVPLSTLKVNPGKIVNQANQTHRPILLTSRGRGVAVVQSLDDYEDHEEEREFMKAVTKGILEAKEGKSIGLRDVKRKLGIK